MEEQLPKTTDITPRWMSLAQIALDDLRRSDIPTRKFTIELLTQACEKLDGLNDHVKEVK